VTLAFDSLSWFRFSSFIDLSPLFSTVFDNEQQMGNSDRIDGEERIGEDDRIDDEEPIGKGQRSSHKKPNRRHHFITINLRSRCVSAL
jgi:hypothetical protein